jgi:O-antigen chain-terminating methyltransferase
LEHLAFDQVLQLIELIVPRLESEGTLVIVLPNPESIRMHLFGFWRDPEHVRFYHPELIEGVCRHYGLDVVHSNLQEEPFALSPPTRAAGERPTAAEPHAPVRWWRRAVRDAYVRVLRSLRVPSRGDIAALEAQVRRDQAVFEDATMVWAERATWAINRMWAWPDNALIVCRKRA